MTSNLRDRPADEGQASLTAPLPHMNLNAGSRRSPSRRRAPRSQRSRRRRRSPPPPNPRRSRRRRPAVLPAACYPKDRSALCLAWLARVVAVARAHVLECGLSGVVAGSRLGSEIHDLRFYRLAVRRAREALHSKLKLKLDTFVISMHRFSSPLSSLSLQAPRARAPRTRALSLSLRAGSRLSPSRESASCEQRCPSPMRADGEAPVALHLSRGPLSALQSSFLVPLSPLPPLLALPSLRACRVITA